MLILALKKVLMVKITPPQVRTTHSGSILESKGMRAIFQKKGKKRQKGWNIWKSGQKCTKFENILKKGRWLRAIIARYKLLE